MGEVEVVGEVIALLAALIVGVLIYVFGVRRIPGLTFADFDEEIENLPGLEVKLSHRVEEGVFEATVRVSGTDYRIQYCPGLLPWSVLSKHGRLLAKGTTLEAAFAAVEQRR